MTTTLDADTLYDLRGNNVVDRNGDKIGSFDELYLDRETGAPEWAAVKTGLFGMNVNLVPLEGADRRADDLQVAYDADQVKNAPDIDADQEISEEEELRLYSHYGLDYSTYEGDDFDATFTDETATDETRRDEAHVDTDETYVEGDAGYRDDTVARDTSGPEADSAMTRAEEEVHVDTTQRERGRVRLRKYVETDTVTKTVPVKREVARVETEQVTDEDLDDALESPALSDDEAEVTLSEEEVVVKKRAVPKERVRLETDVVSEDREVTEEVGRERVEVDDDAEIVEGDVRR